MRLTRAWPSHPPSGRSYVVDDVERVPVDEYDYRALVDVDDDVLLLDWDMAVHREDLAEFARRARQDPGRVLVAPYLAYPDTRPGLPRPTWTMRRYEPTGLTRYVHEGESTCHLFGFGMTYLPRHLIVGFAESNPALRFDDTTFAQWLHRTADWEVPITWDIRPVHLNYLTRSVSL